MPLYTRIVIAMLVGIVLGLSLGRSVDAADAARIGGYVADVGKLVLRLLLALAVPLIFVAILHALVAAKIDGKSAKRLIVLLATNTFVAIVIGLVVANLLQPGRWGKEVGKSDKKLAQVEMWEVFKEKVPTSVVGSLTPSFDKEGKQQQQVIPAIIIALALGIALRVVRSRPQPEGKEGLGFIIPVLETLYQVFMVVLHWIIELIPLAVLCIVVNVTATQGLSVFVSLAGFVVAVLVALALQACYYLMRVRLQSWVRPMQFLRGGSEALMAAFCTASSTATAPLNFRCLREKIGLREESATLGALVGSNFNNDGTALYEAMGPMYIAQATGNPIPLIRQPVVALMSVVASVGAPGIPEAGLVTMILVFQAVGLDTAYVAYLLPIDWFLDRCRTAINLMGDMSVACVLDGKTPEFAESADKK